MKVNELVNLMKQNKSKLLKAEQVQAFLKKELNVKEYLSIKEKKELVQDIVNECILYEDGVFKFDNIDKYICFTMMTIAAYTDIELSDDIEDDYDMLCKSGLLTAVVNTFTEEYDSVNLILQMKCDYILSGNTMEAQFGKFLEGVSDKLDVLVNAISGKIAETDIGKLMGDINREDVSKLLSFVKTIN